MRSNAGRYQCIASNSVENVTESAELKLRLDDDIYCDFSEYRCTNGKCISWHSFCDGVRDCINADDEAFCCK